MPRVVLVAGAVTAVVTVGVLARPDGGTVGPSAAPTAEPTAGPQEDEGWPPAGTWRPMAAAPGGPRSDHTTVWTGLCSVDAPPRSCGELLVWGGRDADDVRADGLAYHMQADRWRAVPDAPRRPLAATALPGVWTGAAPASHPGELVVWGAIEADLDGDAGAPGEPRGVAYDPVAAAWRALPEAPIEPRVGHTLTWTGDDVLVWGGRRVAGEAAGEPLTDGAAYDPRRDTWRPLRPAPLAGRHDHAAVWLPEAGRLAVWGGVSRHGQTPTPIGDGAVYDPAEDAWRPLPLAPVTARGRPGSWQPGATRLLDPERLVVVAPLHDPATGAAITAVHDPAAGDWELWPAGPVGGRGGAHVAGASRVVVWGGADVAAAPAGALYDPREGTWWTAPAGREPAAGESATWTGTTLVTWGGGREGAIWDPDPGRRGEP